MSPLKLSLFGAGSGDEPDETVEIDDTLAGRLREIVEATPDLTMAEALRQGIQRVVDDPPAPPVPPGR